MMREYEDLSRVCNFVFDGTNVLDVSGSITVMVSGQAQLSALASKVKPGSIAYVSGWSKAWQLGPDGTTWTQMIGE